MVRPAAFLSYAHADDQVNRGKLSQVRERLQELVCMHTGSDEFEIFQDWKHITWGELWKRRIDGELDTVLFLIPILTPRFFQSEQCRREAERFLARERRGEHHERILPIHYIDCDELREPGRFDDPLVRAIAARQWRDLREVRRYPVEHDLVEEQLDDLAMEIKNAITVARAESDQARVESGQAGSASAIEQRNTHGVTIAVTGQVRDINVSIPAPTQNPAASDRPTLIVDPSGGGDSYPSISAAVAEAPPEGLVVVRPGLYAESIVIEQPLELIGEPGRAGRPRVQVQGDPALVFSATEGRVANLTFHHLGTGDDRAIQIASGQLVLEDCDVTSQDAIGVVIARGATPILRRNEIHRCGRCSVLIHGDATLEDNDIAFSYGAGVEITEGANPTLYRNRIRSSGKSGIVITDGGRGYLHHNKILNNQYAGVLVAQEGDPVVRSNEIQGNLWQGICVIERGRGRFEHNNLRGNHGGAWDISPNSRQAVFLVGNRE